MHCDSPIEACHKFHMASFPSIGASNAIQSVASYDQVARQLVVQPGLDLGFLLTLDSISKW